MMNCCSKDKIARETGNKQTGKSELLHLCPSKLSKRELEDIYFTLLQNNLDLKKTINRQSEKVKLLSTKLQRMTVLQKTYGRDNKDTPTGNKAAPSGNKAAPSGNKAAPAENKGVVNDQKEAIAELKRANVRLSERIKQLNMRLCTLKQYRKRSPSKLSNSKFNASRPASDKHSSTSALIQKKTIKINLKKAISVSCQCLDREEKPTKTAGTETDAEKKEVPSMMCDENMCKPLMEELKHKIVNLQEELAKTHEEYSNRITRLESEVSDLYKQNLRARSAQAQRDQNEQVVSGRLRDAEAKYDDLAAKLLIEKGKVAELETQIKAADLSNHVAKTIEDHLNGVNTLNAKQKESSPARHDSSFLLSPESKEQSPKQGKQDQSDNKKSDDSGYTDNERESYNEEISKMNEELMKRINDLQNQLETLRNNAAEKAVDETSKREPSMASYKIKLSNNDVPVLKNVKDYDCLVVDPDKRVIVKMEHVNREGNADPSADNKNADNKENAKENADNKENADSPYSNVRRKSQAYGNQPWQGQNVESEPLNERYMDSPASSPPVADANKRWHGYDIESEPRKERYSDPSAASLPVPVPVPVADANKRWQGYEVATEPSNEHYIRPKNRSVSGDSNTTHPITKKDIEKDKVEQKPSSNNTKGQKYQKQVPLPADSRKSIGSLKEPESKNLIRDEEQMDLNVLAGRPPLDSIEEGGGLILKRDLSIPTPVTSLISYKNKPEQKECVNTPSEYDGSEMYHLLRSLKNTDDGNKYQTPGQPTTSRASADSKRVDSIIEPKKKKLSTLQQESNSEIERIKNQLNLEPEKASYKNAAEKNKHQAEEPMCSRRSTLVSKIDDNAPQQKSLNRKFSIKDHVETETPYCSFENRESIQITPKKKDTDGMGKKMRSSELRNSLMAAFDNRSNKDYPEKAFNKNFNRALNRSTSYDDIVNVLKSSKKGNRLNPEFDKSSVYLDADARSVDKTDLKTIQEAEVDDDSVVIPPSLPKASSPIQTDGNEKLTTVDGEQEPLENRQLDICSTHAHVCTCPESARRDVCVFRSCSGTLRFRTESANPQGFRRCKCSAGNSAGQETSGSQASPKDEQAGRRTSASQSNRVSAVSSEPHTYTLPGAVGVVKCARSTSPENTDHEISSLTDLPSERDDGSQRPPLSPGENKATSTLTESLTTPTPVDYMTLSEGEITQERADKRLSREEKQPDNTSDGKSLTRVTSAQKMEAALEAIGEELARCRQLLLQNKHSGEKMKPSQRDASSMVEACPSPIALRKSEAKARIGDTFTPKCVFTIHIGIAVLSDEAVINSHDLNLMLTWQFYEQTATMTRMRAGRVLHFDFSTEYEIKLTDEFLNYMKFDDMPILICELDRQEQPFASCTLPLRDVLLHTNKRVDMSLALVAGPRMLFKQQSVSSMHAGEELGVLDLWCMLRAEPRLLPRINKTVAKSNHRLSLTDPFILNARDDDDLEEDTWEQRQYLHSRPNSNDRDLDLGVYNKFQKKPFLEPEIDIKEYQITNDDVNKRKKSIQLNNNDREHENRKFLRKSFLQPETDSQKYKVTQDDVNKQSNSIQRQSITSSPRQSTAPKQHPDRQAPLTSSPSPKNVISPMMDSDVSSAVIVNEVPANIRSTNEMKKAIRQTYIDTSSKLQIQDTHEPPSQTSIMSVKSLMGRRPKEKQKLKLSNANVNTDMNDLLNNANWKAQEATKGLDMYKKVKINHKNDLDNKSSFSVIPKSYEKPNEYLDRIHKTIDITILWLALNEQCPAMLDPKVQRLYVTFSFLGRKGADLETPVSQPKPKMFTDKCYYFYKKTFKLTPYELPLLGRLARCRSSVRGSLNTRDCVAFTIVTEPAEDRPGLNCEDIGYANLYFGDLLAYSAGSDTYTEVLPIRSVNGDDVVCGVLAVKVDGLDVVRQCQMISQIDSSFW